MQIDFRKDADHALRYAVFDAVTGKRLDDTLPIVFADDIEGVIERFERTEYGGAFVTGHDGMPAVIEERRKIDIVRKA